MGTPSHHRSLRLLRGPNTRATSARAARAWPLIRRRGKAYHRWSSVRLGSRTRTVSPGGVYVRVLPGCRSSSPQFRNIRSVNNGCACAARTASSLMSGLKVGSDGRLRRARQAVLPAMRDLASGRVRACSGRPSLCTESKARQQVKCREMQRTYGCPALEKTCSKKVLFSKGVTSHSFGQFSTSAWETRSTCNTWFVLEKSRSAL